MKYNKSNRPLVCMMTQSTCYKQTSKMTIKGILWHSTGVNNNKLSRYVQPSDEDPKKDYLLSLLGVNKYNNDWNHTKQSAGVNGWIGKLKDGSISTVQTLPWEYRPWGCGSGSKGSCNNGWIQFELCEDDLSSKEYFQEVYKEACELTAYLCHIYSLDPKGSVLLNGVNVPVILCHADSYRLGLGSNHKDVNHWFSRFGKSMTDVRNDVAKVLSEYNSNYLPYLVKINVNTLNIRKGPSIDYKIVSTVKYAECYTIIEESNGWGLLKSKVGWINLSYTKKI